jgi:hypothetical protein
MRRWSLRRVVGGVGSYKSGVKSNFHANSSSPSVAGPGDVGSAKALAGDLQSGRMKGRAGAMLAKVATDGGGGQAGRRYGMWVAEGRGHWG